MTGNQSVSLSIEGMSCASCVGRVDRALSGLEGIGDVSVNLANETARMTVDGPERLAEAADKLDELGYPARRASGASEIAGHLFYLLTAEVPEMHTMRHKSCVLH